MGLGPGEGETRDKQGMTGAWMLSQDTEGQLLSGCWPLPQMFPKHLWKQAQEAKSRAMINPRGNKPSLPPCPASLQHSESLASAGPVASRLGAEVAAATRPGSSLRPAQQWVQSPGTGAGHADLARGGSGGTEGPGYVVLLRGALPPRLRATLPQVAVTHQG